MKQIQEQALTTSPQPDQSKEGGARVSAQVSLWELNLLRVGYLVLVMGVGLAVVKWPLLFDHGPGS